MKKRIVSLLLALVMAVSLLPVSAFAVDGAYTVAKDTAVQQGDDVSSVQTTGTSDYGFIIATEKDESKAIELETLDSSLVNSNHRGNDNYKIVVPSSTATVYIKFTSDKFVDATAYVADYNNSPAKRCVSQAYKDNLSGKYTTPPGSIMANQYTVSKNYQDGWYAMPVADLPTVESIYPGLTFSPSYSYYTAIIFQFANNPVTPAVKQAVNILIQAGEDGAGLTDEQKKPLTDLLATVADGNTNYYQSNDRWNGKTASKAGFWTEFTATYGPRATAQKALESASKEEYITTAVADLTAAIANLIPAERANTTLLYEELQKSFTAEDYTAKTWAAYQTARDKGKALMDTMFNAEGNPTDDNKAAVQESIEAMAAELETARKALAKKAGDESQSVAKLEIEAIRYLAKKYDPDTLTGYTAESLQALRDARTAALTLADSVTVNDMSTTESNLLSTALCNLRRAVYGLTTTDTAQISVKVSVLDTNDIYKGYTGELAYLHNPNTYTASLTLDANASAYDLLNSNNWLKRYNVDSEPLVFLNGELVKGNGTYSDWGTGGEYSMLPSIKLHSGDALTLVWIYPKQVEYSSQVGTYPELFIYIRDWFRYSTISAPVEEEQALPSMVCICVSYR